MKFRKKPVVIEAVQLPKDGEYPTQNCIDFLHGMTRDWEQDRDGGIVIHTLEGDMKASPEDWIIKGIQGEFYPCKPDIFAQTYEPVD